MASSVSGMTVLEPSAESPWFTGHMNVLRWTNATWNTTEYGYKLQQPFNASIRSLTPSMPGNVNLGVFNGTDGEALIDMTKWQEQGNDFLLQFYYYVPSSGASDFGTSVFFGSSDNFSIISFTPSTTAKPQATGLVEGGGSDGSSKMHVMPWFAVLATIVLAVLLQLS